MIPIEWQRLLDGKDKFEDVEVEEIVNVIKEQLAVETDSVKIVQLTNDLEIVLGQGEWLTRKVKRLQERINNDNLREEEKTYLQEKIDRCLQRRNEVVARLKAKYGLE